ncbi:ABC transporter ATP-binding protein [Myroides marinus]|uniref:ABC-type multidrug transport system, ATPase component n=1 Tax=Myroides marinus TaxID=703342 RepID=A0A163VKK5_9FLAO|nr:ABC transporter ATP-binding protein [Myroides marinus]KUF39471.1 multidrug ABC transporter ATP-binding protein [Myroides marinus]KZE75020.1 multidrug ABC transporter ATP-binding protein [Myroides marinus]MDM1345915.1 ABC transporter ATP-binding protein [Myroides marinus]MDM1349224.1 ABC transporter ATP-binding protein [Myroides marinus]MDM1353098.1 ABC transporter ATP-binding protein [Myroides marinus]
MKLVIKNLNKTYKNGVKAIDNLNLEIGAGMFGLLGPNGAGKSSLMRTIATLQKPDSGSIHFGDINILEQQNEFRKMLGYLPQDFGVYPNMSALDLLDYFARLKGIAKASERNEIVTKVLEVTNLYEVRRKSVSGYSGGMKQRFGIAQLLLNDPKLIIVDEPTAGLDPAERHRFLNVLREIGNNNTVIFSTHIVDDVNELCHEMAILNGGNLLERSTPKEAEQKLEGKIWTRETTREMAEELNKELTILSGKYNQDNNLNIRAYSEVSLAEAGFVQVKPNLEDVYFVALKNG